MTDSPPAELVEIASEFERWFVARLARLDLPENLADAVRYAALGGGKRLRPVLAMLCCQAVGGNRRMALPPAAAIELIHCFSLVHDDLPAMDDDDLRRGRPSLHVHAGEAMAILAGDAMLSLAFQLVCEGGEELANEKLTTQVRRSKGGRTTATPGSESGGTQAGTLAAELASATTRMIAGQVLDTLGGFPRGISEREMLSQIHHSKTGALLRASCRIGGICGEADHDQLVALTQYGEAIGLMFQIVDDLIDVMQSPQHTGKATGKDSNAGKVTFPGVLGIEESMAEIRRLHQVARGHVEPLGHAANPLRELCDYMATRTR